MKKDTSAKKSRHGPSCDLCSAPAAAFVDDRPFCLGCLLRLLGDPESAQLVGMVRPIGEHDLPRSRRRAPLSRLMS